MTSIRLAPPRTAAFIVTTNGEITCMDPIGVARRNPIDNIVRNYARAIRKQHPMMRREGIDFLKQLWCGLYLDNEAELTRPKDVFQPIGAPLPQPINVFVPNDLSTL